MHPIYWTQTCSFTSTSDRKFMSLTRRSIGLQIRSYLLTRVVSIEAGFGIEERTVQELDRHLHHRPFQRPEPSDQWSDPRLHRLSWPPEKVAFQVKVCFSVFHRMTWFLEHTGSLSCLWLHGTPFWKSRLSKSQLDLQKEEHLSVPHSSPSQHPTFFPDLECIRTSSSPRDQRLRIPAEHVNHECDCLRIKEHVTYLVVLRYFGYCCCRQEVHRCESHKNDPKQGLHFSFTPPNYILGIKKWKCHERWFAWLNISGVKRGEKTTLGMQQPTAARVVLVMTRPTKGSHEIIMTHDSLILNFEH